MELLRTASVDGRACCAAGEEVWVGKQSGGIAVFAARTGDRLLDIDVTADDGATAAQVSHMMAVLGEVWVSTLEGRVHIFDLASRRSLDSILLPGAEKKVRVVGLLNGGHIAVVAAASGSVYLHHPLTHKRLGTLSTSTSPCTAVALFYSFVVGGDASGALYLWDPLSGECVHYHGESKSEVLALLHEPTTGTMWVSRANEHVDVYAVVDGALQLQRRVSGVGRVTGMVAVSGTVVATTFTRRLVQIDAATARIAANVAGAHDTFIHGCCKAMHEEVAQVWSVGNDGALRAWRVPGVLVPVVSPPHLPPAAQAALASAVAAHFESEQSALRVEVQAAQRRSVDVADELRKAREEAQELRLRLSLEEEKRLAVDAELAAERRRRVEVEERNAALTKDVIEITSKVSTVERERNSLRGEVTQLQLDLSKSRTDTSTRQTEKTSVEKLLSEERTQRSVMEQRLRDTEGRLSSLQAEHRRVCDAVGSVAASQQSMNKAAQDDQVKSGAAVSAELEQARRMNALMSAAIASMEYTIRRREEEDRDLTALLNAFRRRVADRVTDPNLAALLLATIVRNAPRFDLECDEFTKAQLMDRNGPFLQFIQSLRATDPEAYQKLMQYLQNPSAAQGLPAEAQALLDRLVTLAASDGAVSEADLSSFKKTIPVFTDAAGIPDSRVAAGAGVSGLGGGGAVPPSLAALLGAGGVAGGVAPTASGGLTQQDQEVVNNALVRELRGQRLIDENYIREQQAMFEFILKTRRLLVESLAVLQKRTASARQVVEALCLNTAAASTSSPATTPSRKSLQPLQNIFSGIVRELEELASDVVQRYLTSAEKQRLGVVQ
ncbi:hypothetical protein NESM_000599500 [Novymonas esmeraldas]|uniref:Guanine nucleotide-binding protein subunit beta-like protein n=1 Tax=Novymonas esmeraldas TaxID=1808958 RepID=A0AAW0ET66_9TRYP